MRFAVPQFIDVEDKIFGSLTLKQGVYLLGAGGGVYLMFSLFGYLGAVLVGGPMVVLAVLLAFVKINKRPFISIASAAFFYTLKNKLYLWKKVEKKQEQASTEEAATNQQTVSTPALTKSRLRALAFSLDTEEGYRTEDA